GDRAAGGQGDLRRRAERPGPGAAHQRDPAQVRGRGAAPDAGHPLRQPVGVVLLRPDGLPRPARLRRAGGVRDHPVDGPAEPARPAARPDAGADRPLLAFRRHRLDFPFPLALPGLSREAAHMATDPHALDPAAEHGPSFRAYMVVALALAVFTASSFVVNTM